MIMAIKQGQEKTEFVKDEDDKHDKYVLQKNTKTKTAVYIIIGFLVLIILGVIVSAIFFGAPAT